MGTQDVRTSQCPVLGLPSASTWLVYMHVTELHVCKLYNMVFKAILCNKHNTDMHHTDDYMVVRECMYICTCRSKS